MDQMSSRLPAHSEVPLNSDRGKCKEGVKSGRGGQQKCGGAGWNWTGKWGLSLSCAGKTRQRVSRFVRARQGLCRGWTAEGRECGGRHAAITNDHKSLIYPHSNEEKQTLQPSNKPWGQETIPVIAGMHKLMLPDRVQLNMVYFHNMLT